MKKNFIMIALASVLMMPVSCTKNEMDAPKGPSSSEFDLVEMSFTALTEGNGTKTSIDLSDGSVNWAAGDAIKLTWELSKEVSEASSEVLTADDIVDGSATFKVAVPSDFQNEDTEYTSRHMYAVYPASIELDYSTASSLYVTVPDVQDGTFANASIALAKWYYGKPLAFKNLCGLLQVVVEDSAVRRIVLEASENIAGKVDVGKFDSGIVKVNNVEEGKKSITVNVNGAGTYYVAVLPGELSDVYVELFDANNKCIGDRKAENVIPVVRKQVRNLGKLATGNFTAAGGFFVKKDGEGDGSSWDDAANYEIFRKKLDNSTATAAEKLTVYMSGETYSVASPLNVSKAHECVILGGFPANASGYSLAGRDLENNKTVLDGGSKESGHSNHRIWNLTAGVWDIDGITFQNAKMDVGGALQLKNAVKFTCKNSIFEGNEATTTGGGAVFLATITTDDVKFINCQFGNNSALSESSENSGLGGAIGCGSNSTGSVTFMNCVFAENTSYRGGGALWTRSVGYRLEDCTLKNNISTKNAGTIFMDRDATIYCDGCYITSTSEEKAGTLSAITINLGKFGMNNSTIAGPWGANAKVQLTNKSISTIVNSTLYGQIGGKIIDNLEGATCNVVNSIVPNAASTGSAAAFANAGTLNIHYSLYSSAPETAVVDDYSLSGIKVQLENNSNFPADGNVWYVTNAAAQYKNNRTSTTTVSDCRGTIHYYKWSGIVPESLGSFTNATLAGITQTIQSADANFASWLGDRLGKDIRGVARNTSAMWPGSYEDASASAGVENLNVK